MKREALTLERLKEVLSYDPETGIFRRLIRGGALKPGDIAGGKMINGYITVSVDDRPYLGHRLAWFYMTGKWPERLIDHRDRDRANNRWENLREATHPQNLANARVRSDNTSGVRGVSWSNEMKKWTAQIVKKGRYIGLGYYECIGVAATVYALEFAQTYGEFAGETK